MDNNGNNSPQGSSLTLGIKDNNGNNSPQGLSLTLGIKGPGTPRTGKSTIMKNFGNENSNGRKQQPATIDNVHFGPINRLRSTNMKMKKMEEEEQDQESAIITDSTK